MHDDIQWFQRTFNQIKSNVMQNFIGKEQIIDYVLFCLIGKTHILLEDVPGTGKTQLAKSLASATSLKQSRIQFTPDLLPSDIIGVNIYQKDLMQFKFHPGPLFSNILLADEINRASSKTQSALLEAMGEGSITLDSVTHTLAPPFFVIATQNPIEQSGTYELPEAELDRFGIKTSIGYLSKFDTINLLKNVDMTPEIAPNSATPITSDDILRMQSYTQKVDVKPSILEYIYNIIDTTRKDSRVKCGVSQRGAIVLLNLCKVRALSQGRDYLLPDDVLGLSLVTLCHRIILTDEAEFDHITPTDIISDILKSIPVPQN